MKKSILLCLLFISCHILAQTTGKLFDTRDSKSYNAVRIGLQWWMAQNLNYGTIINSSVNATNNGHTEKYCYSNIESNCNTYGGLYTWDELMNYLNIESIRGICPSGWHIPSDSEWISLEMYLGMSSSQASLLYDWRGTTEGTQLKTGGVSGFNALMAGYKNSTPVFENLGNYGYFWSSTNYNTSDSYMRILGDTQSKAARWTYHKTDGISLRCVKNTDKGLFSLVYPPLANSGSGSSSSWGDYDKDGDLDILYGKARYRNTSGTFSYHGGYSEEIVFSFFCDYNNNTYLDYLYSETGVWPCGQSALFTNTGSSFDSSYFEMQCCADIRMAWGDFDNSGSQDIIVEKWNDPPLGSNVPRTFLFRNDNKSGSFTDCNVEIPHMHGGSVNWGDFDNDLDIDLLITGIDGNGNKETFVFRNDEGSFKKTGISLARISDGEAKWADYDSDGDLDIVLSGTSVSGLAKIYRNDGNEQFTDIQTGFENVAGKVSVADMDNDGMNDIIFCGTKSDTVRVIIYRNNGYDSFLPYLNTLSVTSVRDIHPGDYDNDGDLDLLIGKTILRSNFSLINQPPAIPAGLKTRIRGNEVIFTWEGSTDDHTNSKGLTYNLRVGTSPGGSNILCPPSNNSGNKLTMPVAGNTFCNTGWKLKDLEPGIYYWSVQAVDNSFASSAFSVSSTFEILEEYAEVKTVFNKFNSNPGYSMDVGDYDNDGDYDLACSNFYDEPNFADTTFIFKNVSHVFQKVRAGLPQLKNSSALWVDLDNDNKLELVLSGKTFQNTLITDIYVKQTGDNFTPLHSGLKGLYKGSLDCADYDNDGDRDILLTGMDLSGACYTILYENNDMTFAEHVSSLDDVAEGSAVWADVNLDGYFDIILSGRNATGTITKVYLNNKKKSFSESGFALEPICGRIDVSDTDNDQFPDFVISGIDSVANKYSVVYNNNHGGFSKTENNLTGFDKGTVKVGDYDVNGRSDILLSKFYNTSSTYLYLDSDAVNSYEQSMYFNFGQSACFIDYDSDNDLDLFVTGYDNNMYGKMAFVKNNYYAFNTPPSAPINLFAIQEKFGLVLNWDRSTDFESVQGGLTYNIRVGSTPGGCDIVSPMSASNGKMRRPGMGNTHTSNSWIIGNLPIGTYYWSVQAVDQSFCGGPWAPEQMIDISKISADFSADIVCEGIHTSFKDLSEITEGSITAWKWYFGDGDSSSVRNPVHQYQKGGDYWVTLTAFSDALQHSKTRKITVQFSPYANYSASTVCEGNKTTFVNLSDTDSITVDNWIWNFGDGDVSDVRGDVQHPYLAPGAFDAQLLIKATNGCADSLSTEVIVGKIPNNKIGLDYGSKSMCTGDSSRLVVESNKDYGYQWKKDGINLAKDTLNALLIKDKGDFSVEIINRLGNCRIVSDTIGFTLLEAPSVMTVTSGADTVICQGESVYFEVPYYAIFSYDWKYNGNSLGATSHFINADREGSYAVNVSNGTCSTLSRSKQVVYKPGLSKPTLTAYGPNVWYFVCSSENVEAYRWYYNGNLVTENKSNLFYAGNNLGEYFVEVNDGGECFIPSDKLVIPFVPTATDDLSAENTLCLYPNPASGNIRVLYSGLYRGDVLIRIVSAAGGMAKEYLMHKDHADLSEELDLTGFEPGMYFLELLTNNGKVRSSFIIMK